MINKLEFVSKAKAIIDGTTHIYRIVDTIDAWSSEKKKSFIDESFYTIVNYSFKHVPYYHKLFIDNGLNPGEFTNIESVSKIPVLTKDIIRANYEHLRSVELLNIKHQDRRSGGTTGEPIRSLVSKEACAYETFSYFKGLTWMGWNPSMKFVKIFGGSLGINTKFNIRQKVYKYALNSYFIPAFNLSSSSIVNYFNDIKNEKSICILGYASGIFNFVNLLKSNNLKLNNVKLVITTSEHLISDWEVTILNYFHCPIRSYYGCGEIGSLGYQELNCDKSYRIPIEHVYIESTHNDELAITQLFNKAQPLIRYENGDVGQVNGSSDKRKIDNLTGRTADFFIRHDGTKVSPIFGTVSIQNTLIPVKQYQYIQYSNQIIEFRYIMEYGKLTVEHKETLRNIINSVMGEVSKIVFNETSDFELSISGKHRITVTLNKKFEI